MTSAFTLLLVIGAAGAAQLGCSGGDVTPDDGGQGGGATSSTVATGGGSSTTSATGSSATTTSSTTASGTTSGTGGSDTSSATSGAGGSGAGGSDSGTGGGDSGAGGSDTSSATSGTGGAGGGEPLGDEIPMEIPTPTNGDGEIRTETTRLKNAANGGQDVYDFNNQKIGVNNTEDCDDGEGQKTVFEVEDGVTVKNLIIAGGLPGGNGIVCLGDCTLDHVYWEDVCEDAATNSKDGATMRINSSIALHSADKIFQHNAKGGSTTIVTNSYIADFGKLWRSCGDCTANGGPRNLIIDNVRVDGVKTTIAGANQNYGDTVTITDLYVKGGYDEEDDKPKICQEYEAVTDHKGESKKLHGGASQWNTETCRVSKSDVKSW
ncbi:pectate lyase [Sorangium sp. So ce1036]|uniref:pectate lyase n=1 Tax=Sorangium sp. So ce1036 TaxID=3133328 RepID=UPI003F058779